MIKYRSLRRALKRGHYIDIRTGTYRSKKEQRTLREIHAALMRKESKQDGSGAED